MFFCLHASLSVVYFYEESHCNRVCIHVFHGAASNFIWYLVCLTGNLQREWFCRLLPLAHRRTDYFNFLSTIWEFNLENPRSILRRQLVNDEIASLTIYEDGEFAVSCIQHLSWNLDRQCAIVSGVDSY